MERLIFELRKALIQYEECVDVGAAEHITASALMNLSAACKDVRERCGQMIEAICEWVKVDDCDSGAIPLPATHNNTTTITTHLSHIITAKVS